MQNRWTHRLATICCTLILLLATPSRAPAAERGVDYTTTDHPLVTSVYTATPPRVDGRLDDEVWKSAVRLDDFYEPDLDRAPSEATIAWIAHDSTHLYLAARLFDRHTDQLAMEQTVRSASLFNDDYIAFEIDVAHQHRFRGGYVFRVNPRGTQDERIPGGSAGKTEWRGDWTATAQIDSAGWSAEFSVPLILFNQPAGRHVVGLQLFRRIQRTQEAIKWPNMGAEFDRTRAGDLLGIVWPEQDRRPMFMPYIVMQLPETIVDEDDDGVADEKQAWVEAYAGIDMKYTTAAGPVVVGTIYPDFRNVENEILGLDFSYTEQWRDDNRPFFAEGKRYFPDSWIFYTNRIEEMYTGGKMFGQLGNHRIGLIDAYDRNKVNHLAGAWYWQPITRLEMEHNVTWWHGPKDAPRRDEAPLATDNVVVVSEIRKSRLSGNSTEYYVMQGGFSRTASDTGSGIGDGTHFEARFDRFGGNGSIGANLKFRYFSPGFMAFDGLTDMQESDQRDASIHLEYDRQFDRYWFRELEIEGFARYAERVDGDIAAKIGSGVLYTRIAKVGGWISIIPGAGIGTEYREEERPPYHDRKGEVMLWWNDNTLYSGGDVGVRFGRVEGGDYLLVSASQGARALGALSTALRTQYQRREFPFGYDDDRPLGGIEHSVQVIGTLQYDISPERAISGRLSYIDSDQKWPLTYGDVGDHLNGYATFRQVVRSGLDLFLIVGDPSADTWTKRVALKAMFVI